MRWQAEHRSKIVADSRSRVRGETVIAAKGRPRGNPGSRSERRQRLITRVSQVFGGGFVLSHDSDDKLQ